MNLYEKNHWIFDMDGTLTRSIHDFKAIKQQLGLPLDQGILESLAALPINESARKRQELDHIEFEVAKRSEVGPGVRDLLTTLLDRGKSLGVLTRNSRCNALTTLEACGLLGFFDTDYILGRDEAIPKPNPEGLLKLMRSWAAGAQETVMVGDFKHDLAAGRAADCTTIYVDPDGCFPHRSLADICCLRLDELLD